MWSSASPTERVHAYRRAILGFLFLLLFLGGCATTQAPAPTPSGTWASRRDALLELSEWQLQGRIALNAGKDGWSGNFTWKQVDDDLDFRFNGPLGIGGFRIYGNEKRLRVETSDGERFDLNDPESDLRQRYGWSIPLYSMRYWMLGVPDPQSHSSETLDDAQELISLEQRGWRVGYEGYGETEGAVLPHKVTMDGEGLRIKVIAEQWQVGP